MLLPASIVTSPLPWVVASMPKAPPTAPPSWVIEMSPALAAFRFSTRMPSEFAPVPVAMPVTLSIVMAPTPVALSRSVMPLPARPVMFPVIVSTMLAGLIDVPPDAVKSSPSPLDAVMSAAPVTVNVPPFDDCPVMVPVKLWPTTLSSCSVSAPPAKVTVCAVAPASSSVAPSSMTSAPAPARPPERFSVPACTSIVPVLVIAAEIVFRPETP